MPKRRAIIPTRLPNPHDNLMVDLLQSTLQALARPKPEPSACPLTHFNWQSDRNASIRFANSWFAKQCCLLLNINYNAFRNRAQLLFKKTEPNNA